MARRGPPTPAAAPARPACRVRAGPTATAPLGRRPAIGSSRSTLVGFEAIPNAHGFFTRLIKDSHPNLRTYGSSPAASMLTF